MSSLRWVPVLEPTWQLRHLNSNFRHSDTLIWPLQELHIHGPNTYMQVKTHLHIKIRYTWFMQNNAVSVAAPCLSYYPCEQCVDFACHLVVCLQLQWWYGQGLKLSGSFLKLGKPTHKMKNTFQVESCTVFRQGLGLKLGQVCGY